MVKHTGAVKQRCCMPLAVSHANKKEDLRKFGIASAPLLDGFDSEFADQIEEWPATGIALIG
jgi:hypothetical protein